MVVKIMELKCGGNGKWGWKRCC